MVYILYIYIYILSYEDLILMQRQAREPWVLWILLQAPHSVTFLPMIHVP